MSTIAATTPAVFITVPKYVAITPNNTLPKIRPAPPTSNHQFVVKSVGSPATSEYSSSVSDDGAPKNKKRRLDHLTWEEKIQRKKLKNRVAAQTSRDRKKARMEEMDHEIQELNEKTEILQNKCESLQAINESLMAKNQKLDMEVELLREQLTELQKQQEKSSKQSPQTKATTATVATCAGCESILNGSAAGINKNDGLPVGTSAATVTNGKPAENQYTGSTMEDCSNLPTLQDMLVLDLINNDEEFDANKLEELAESLLADITADMEANDRACDEAATQITSGAERLSGSMVGTTTECMESSEHSKTDTDSISIKDRQTTATKITLPNKIELNESYNLSNSETQSHQQQQHILLQTPANEANFSNDVENDNENTTPDTVYGTYDAMTNSIIVMEVGSAPVSEAVEEIYCDGIKPSAIDDDVIKCPSPAASPSQVYLNVDCSDDEDDLDFDPIAKFLCPKRPLVSPLAKSPALSTHSANSDHGYESIIGSPLTTLTTMADETFDTIEDFNWNHSSFNDLFPTLI